jgi:hypothetical protein
MKPRNILSLLILLLLVQVLCGQNNDQKKLDFNFYYRFEFSSLTDEQYGFHDTFKTNQKQFSFGNLSPAFRLYTKKSVHEFELTHLSILREDYNYDVSHIGVSYPLHGFKNFEFRLNLRYEYIISLITIKERIGFTISPSIEPYILFSNYKPRLSSEYQTKHFQFGSFFHIIPRSYIHIGERFSLDLNFPVEIYDLRRSRTKVLNPSLSEDDRVNSVFEDDFFGGNFRFRIGLGIRL